MNQALIICDFINEIIHPNGKFKGKGYAAFAAEHNVLPKVSTAIAHARKQGTLVVHVRVGFSPDYRELPKNSPLFGKAQGFGALKLGTWATEFHDSIDVSVNDIKITKHRISAFYGTDLDSVLRERGIATIWLCGCATDLVISSTARDAHDRDFDVNILADCCAAGSFAEHHSALPPMEKIASVIDSTRLTELDFVRLAKA